MRSEPDVPSKGGKIGGTELIRELIPFDAATRQGGSGGLIFLEGLSAMVGIVAAGHYNSSGDKLAMMTPADRVMGLEWEADCSERIEGYTIEQHGAILRERLGEVNHAGRTAQILELCD